MNWIKELINKSVVEEFIYTPLNDLNCKLFVKRDDLIHDEISGNKIRKLKFNLKFCKENFLDGIITFGGAYSNHLLASAAAAKMENIPIHGMVRGEELNANSNAILKRCGELGMELTFLNRTAFSEQKKQDGIVVIDNKKYLVIPEGGSNLLGVEGCKEIISELTDEFDYYCVAQGTTTTSIGIAESLHSNAKLIVVPVLKEFDTQVEMSKIMGVDAFEKIKTKLIILDKFHFGGYAKSTPELLDFIHDFNRQNTFEIEPVYTGKALFALVEFLKSINISNKKVLFVHTGGLFYWKK